VLIVLGVLALLVLVVLAATVFVLKRVVRDVQRGLDDLRRETVPLLAETRSALTKATAEERKADALLDAATSLTGTADAATRFAYRVVTNPFVKVLAFFTGTRRAVSSLGDATAPGGRADRRLKAQQHAVAKSRAIVVSNVESTPRSRLDSGAEQE
jgi:hypothetical protein